MHEPNDGCAAPVVVSASVRLEDRRFLQPQASRKMLQILMKSNNKKELSHRSFKFDVAKGYKTQEERLYKTKENCFAVLFSRI